MKFNLMKRQLLFIFWAVLCLIYAPIYVAAWFLHITARIILAIANIGLLRFNYAKDIFKSIFKWEAYV